MKGLKISKSNKQEKARKKKHGNEKEKTGSYKENANHSAMHLHAVYSTRAASAVIPLPGSNKCPKLIEGGNFPYIIW